MTAPITRTPEITLAATPPVGPLEGDLWWSILTGVEYIWYNDGTTAQWVATNPFVHTAPTNNVGIGLTVVQNGTEGYVLQVGAEGMLAQQATTGTGDVVRKTSPALVTPDLGVPTAIDLTNALNLPLASVTGLGTGVAAALAVNVGTDGAFIVRGGSAGTPSAIVLTNATGLPLTSGVTGVLPIANGGTGQATASAAFNALSPITAVGDLIIGTGVNTAGRLAIGNNTYVLTSDGTTASWQPVPGASITIGTSAIVSGTNGYILYNNAGVVGELATTGTGNVVRANSPALVTPDLGTPSAVNLTNATNLPIGGIAGLGTGVAAALAANVGTGGAMVLFNGAGGTPSSLTLTNATALPIAGVTGWGTGVAAALATNVGTAGAPVLYDGAGGTPSSLTLTNATGLPISSGVSGLAAGIATFLATPSSANLAAAVTDETGSGALVFANGPALVTPDIGAATGTSVSLTGKATLYNATAIPAGGTAGAGLLFSSTANFGVFFGSGAPTLSASQGSIYIRSDGAPYYNNDGTTGWTQIGAGITAANDSATATNLYPLFAAAATGQITNVYTDDGSLNFKPSTGEFTAKVPVAGNGIFVNSATIADDYTIPAGSNAISAGPVSIAAGKTVTVSAGSTWVIA